ncbi:unnamed protein product [Pipistrellus nathusii]|uniref:Uncharacterized protein n=1 Tax=Pipistrellus nathusii TaxID=59473 RepID=A0ABN9ZED6_PIPNA
MNAPSQGTLPRVGAGEPAHSAEQNAETQGRRKMSLAKTLALNKRGKKDGNMQPCQPGWGIASKAGSKDGNQAWACTWMEESCVSTRWVCLLGLAEITCKKGTRKGRWATLATASSSSN